MTDKMNIRLDGIPKNHLHRAIGCVQIYAAKYPDRRGVRQAVIYSPPDGFGLLLFVYRTHAGRLVCRVAGGKDND